MKNKRSIYLLLGLILIVMTVIYFCQDTRVIPLEAETADSIRFAIYPQDDSNYTVTDNDRVKEIVCVINELDMELDMQAGTNRVNRMSNNYYYFWIHMVDEEVSIELDENTISLNNEIYQADTSDLRALLDQTYNDIMQGKID